MYMKLSLQFNSASRLNAAMTVVNQISQHQAALLSAKTVDVSQTYVMSAPPKT
jgi:hypothetical protein